MFLKTRNGIEVPVTHGARDALFADLHAHLSARRGFAMATVNLDHMVRIGRDPDFAAAYACHEIIVADGRPIRWLSRLAGQPAQLMPGSDMILPLARLAAECSRPIALVGSTEAALSGAAARLRAEVPGLEIALRRAPPMGFDPEGAAARALLAELEASGAALCFLALGAPKQERLAALGRRLAPSVGFASIGAGLDFLSGHQRRAPRVMRALALEWLWRAATSPRRLGPRYIRCAAILPGLAWRARRARVTCTR
ncbi:WecB/TagA/CpsF family glycosyltransferase [Roseovarius aquimarinus]|uniref:WecB/TagA/CpsF family glycosyltransferase n=1 Tax=Roseovarius aquimarinus TaxID=1229156 RepID=A0ABW7I4G2_9RHOB